MPADAMSVSTENGGDALEISRGNGKGKLRLLTRAMLDARTASFRQFDVLVRAIIADLGGDSEISTVQRMLIEAVVGAFTRTDDCNARMIIGENVDLMEHSSAITTLVRVASRLPIDRRARDVTPSIKRMRERYGDQEQQDDA